MKEMRREVASGDPTLDRNIAAMLDGATVYLRNGQVLRCTNEGDGTILFKPTVDA